MSTLERRTFLKLLGAAGLTSAVGPVAALGADSTSILPKGGDRPGQVPNEYSLFLPGEQEALQSPPTVIQFSSGEVLAKAGSRSVPVKLDEQIDGWRLLNISEMNGAMTAVFEKHVTHRGAIVYVTQRDGVIAFVPKQIGDISQVRPRPIHSPEGIRLEQSYEEGPQPDHAGRYILQSTEDPSYGNVAALGAEYIGYTLVANEEAGPLRSLFLDARGRSRELCDHPKGEGLWAPDLVRPVFDPMALAPGQYPQIYEYVAGYSKRTMLGGYLPVGDIAVWNPRYRAGYEAIVLLPPGTDAKPMARVRFLVPEGHVTSGDPISQDADGRLFIDRYWNASPAAFYAALVGIWDRWHSLYEDNMPVDVPDKWLLDAARAGITLSRCSYRGLKPTYQIGEGAYTKIPERSHALFPVAQYEFIWAQQLWNLTEQSDAYLQHYLDNYILPDGNFLYNTQDQVEAPLNAGVFLANSARGYFYTRDLAALEKRLPVLRRMTDYVLARYQYSKTHYLPNDRRYGLIWGSPEADLGDPNNDFPDSHPYYYQNAAWTWRGLVEQARCLRAASQQAARDDYAAEAEQLDAIAQEMRQNIQRSLEATLQACDTEMKATGITPFTPHDVSHNPQELSSYENHRFMEDWFTSDWGVPALDLGHLKHRILAREQILELGTDGHVARTSNFMAHGTLSVHIRQPDYRPFLLALYALVCFAADSGNRYSPEDAYIPGGRPDEGNPYFSSAVVNSVLQPALGLRWLLCYEENDQDICHLQKAAPKHWFRQGETISVQHCPTRFGAIQWTTKAVADRQWRVTLDVPKGFSADIHVHIHPSNGQPVRNATLGSISGDRVVLKRLNFADKQHFEIDVS
ncbi:MAG: hypothetical protein ACLQMO_13280 [Acidobacteriaceae bacterium]